METERTWKKTRKKRFQNFTAPSLSRGSLHMPVLKYTVDTRVHIHTLTHIHRCEKALLPGSYFTHSFLLNVCKLTGIKKKRGGGGGGEGWGRRGERGFEGEGGTTPVATGLSAVRLLMDHRTMDLSHSRFYCLVQGTVGDWFHTYHTVGYESRHPTSPGKPLTRIRKGSVRSAARSRLGGEAPMPR